MTTAPPDTQEQVVVMQNAKMPNLYVVLGSVMFVFICALLNILFNNLTDSIKSIGTTAKDAALDAKSSITEIKADVKGIRETNDKMRDGQAELKITLGAMNETIRTIDLRTSTNAQNITTDQLDIKALREGFKR